MTTTTELLTTAEVAELTGWSTTSIHRWATAGDLPYVHKLRGRTGSYLFDPQVVEGRIRLREHAGGLRTSAA